MKNNVLMTIALAIVLLYSPNSFASEFFSDGFESGDLSHTENGANWYGTKGDVTVSSADSHSGTYSMRVRYGADVDWIEQRFNLGAHKKDVFIRYYIKFPSNYVHGSGSGPNNKVIRLWADDSTYGTDMGKMGFSFYPNRPYSTLVPEAKIYRLSGEHLTCASGGMGDITPMLGNWDLTADDLNKWMSFEYHFRRDSGAGDAALEFWVDGVKQFGSTSLSFEGAPCSPGYFMSGYLFGWANSPFAEQTDFYVDDVVFSDSYIGPKGVAGSTDSTSTPQPPLPPENLHIDYPPK